jgi:hypothetical protein
MSQSPFICFSVICATANGYKEIFSSCVDRPGLEYIFHLQGAVVKNARETLRGIDAHQLTVYQNSSAFANKKSPLDASCPLTGLGKTKDDALIILMPSTVRQGKFDFQLLYPIAVKFYRTLTRFRPKNECCD